MYALAGDNSAGEDVENIESMIVFSTLVFVVALIQVLGAFLMKKFPPNYSNSKYGYRTPLSTKNKENWDFAQRISIKKSGECAIISFCFSILGLLIYLDFQQQIIAIFLFFIFEIIYVILATEKALKLFDKENNV